jgi:hypothetical protein
MRDSAPKSRGDRLNALKLRERVATQGVASAPEIERLIDAADAWLAEADARRAMREHKRQCRRCRYADRDGATRVRRCRVGHALHVRRAAWARRSGQV